MSPRIVAAAFLTRGELCARWGISRATSYRMQRDGYLRPPVKFGPNVPRFPLAEIEKIEASASADRGQVQP